VIKNGVFILQFLKNGGLKMSERKLKYLFNPVQKDAQQLKAEFVVRTAIFDQIFSDIQDDKMQNPPQHYMILGQRGMGKTTLLLRLKYAVLDDENLKSWLLPVLFNEEQYAMSDLASFFEHIAILLVEDHLAYESLLKEMRKYEFESDYEQKAFDVLVDFLKLNQQKIIVFHDNFGQFLDKIGKIATHRLRNILMNSPYIRLVGGSATLLEHTANYSKPFFDFFYQIRLKGMTANETILLFKKLAENEGKTKVFDEILKTEAPRIDVIRKLSGGVIRTIVMLFDVFIDSEKQDSFKDLEEILDRVTPLYKHRMDDLKPQQQLIVDAVARGWDAVTVSEIAELTRSDRQGLKTNQISAQLKQLVDNQIIEIEPRTVGRTNLYRLQERFFNIWYLMRYSTRQDKQRVVWFVKFLEGWCDTNALKQLFDRFDTNLENQTYELSTVFDRALAYSMVENEEVAEEQIALLESAILHLTKKDFDFQLLQILRKNKTNLKQKQFSNYLKSLFDIFRKSQDPYMQELFKRLLKDDTGSDDSGLEQKTSILLLMIRYIDNTIMSYDLLSSFIHYFTNLDLSEYIMIGLAKKQYHSTYYLFKQTPELKDRIKPIYFLTMEYLKDEYPNEYLKAGEEYQETIAELKERVSWFESNLN
jgi:hypothetical protein